MKCFDCWVYVLQWHWNHRVKTVSSSCVTSNGDQLLLGTESGHVFIVELKSFRLLDRVMYLDSIIQTWVVSICFSHEICSGVVSKRSNWLFFSVMQIWFINSKWRTLFLAAVKSSVVCIQALTPDGAYRLACGYVRGCAKGCRSE